MTEDEEFEALEQRLNMKEQEYEQINHPNGVTTWKTKPKEQPEALRLARELEQAYRDDEYFQQHAAELRRQFEEIKRLHALNQELLEALELALFAHGKMLLSDPPQEAWKTYGVESKARAAIAKAQGASNE